MNFAPGDLVRVIHERSAFFGKMGRVESKCACLSTVVSITLGRGPMYAVAIDGATCFPADYLRKVPGDQSLNQLVSWDDVPHWKPKVRETEEESA